MSSVSSSNEGGSYYKDMLRKVDSAHEKETKRLQRQHERELEQLGDRYHDNLRKVEDNSRKTIDNMRSKMEEGLERTKEKYSSSLEDLVADTYDSRGKLSSSIGIEEHKREIKNLEEASKRRRENDLKTAENQKAALIANRQKLFRDHDEDIIKLKEQQAQEIQAIDDKARKFALASIEENKKERARLLDTFQTEGKIRDQEAKNLNEGFERANNRLRAKLDDQANFYNVRQAEVLKQKDEAFSELIRQKAEADARMRKESQDFFAREVQELKDQAVRDKERAAQLSNLQLEKLHEQGATALKEQNNNYSRIINDLRANHAARIDEVRKEARPRLSRDGTMELSMGEEEAIKKRLSKEYEVRLKDDLDRNHQNMEAMRLKQNENYRHLVMDIQNKQYLHTREDAKRQADERYGYYSAVDDLQNRLDVEGKELKSQYERELQSLSRSHTNEIEKMRQGYEYAFSVAQDEAEQRSAQLREEFQIKTREQQRTFTERQSDLVRDYEAKLTRQKEDYESQIDAIKGENAKETRAAERRYKQEMEAMSRGFEQRLAQAEQHSKEREKNITQMYQDQFDRTKRSYELAAKKTS